MRGSPIRVRGARPSLEAGPAKLGIRYDATLAKPIEDSCGCTTRLSETSSGGRPKDVMDMESISRIVFTVASFILMLLALALSVYGVYDLVVSAMVSLADGGEALLRAIGYMVIAIAVFDVSKYLIEEEVVRSRELRAASEARRSLTKFISTIAIAVFLEGLVTVFRVSKENVAEMLYPTLLLMVGVLIVLGLGAYQRLSASVEKEVGQSDRRDEGDTSTTGGRSKRK